MEAAFFIGCSTLLTLFLKQRSESAEGKVVVGTIQTETDNGGELKIVQVERGFYESRWGQGLQVLWVPSYQRVIRNEPLFLNKVPLHFGSGPVKGDYFTVVQSVISNQRPRIQQLLGESVEGDGAHLYRIQEMKMKVGDDVAVVIGEHNQVVAMGSPSQMRHLTSWWTRCAPYIWGVGMSLCGTTLLIGVERMSRRFL